MCGKKPCDSWLCSWGEPWRRLTEAKTVCSWPKDRREWYYRTVMEKRGKTAARRLYDDVREIYGVFGHGDG